MEVGALLANVGVRYPAHPRQQIVQGVEHASRPAWVRVEASLDHESGALPLWRVHLLEAVRDVVQRADGFRLRVRHQLLQCQVEKAAGKPAREADDHVRSAQVVPPPVKLPTDVKRGVDHPRVGVLAPMASSLTPEQPNAVHEARVAHHRMEA